MNKKKKIGMILLIIAVIYGGFSLFFTYHYFLGTKINGYSCGGHTVAETKNTIKKSVDHYQIRIKERYNRKEEVTSDEIGLSFVDDGKIEAIKEKQKGYAWIIALFKAQDFENGITLQLDEEKYNNEFETLHAFNKHLVVAPQDAYPRYDETKKAYVIAEEVDGNKVKKKLFKQVLKEAILDQKKSIDIEKSGCYKAPVYLTESPEVKEATDTLNKYVSSKITYDFDDRTQKLQGDTIHTWLYVTKDMKVKVKKDKAQRYIKRLAKKYDTVGIDRSFTSICGNNISVSGGTYGWRIDQEAEVSKLIKQIKKGKKTKRAPEYAHIAKSRKKNDIGKTYVEVSISEQHMWFYKNGKTLVSTDVVTGDISKKRGTPTGVYYILYKTTNYTLTGQGYASDVDYWLPFIQSGVGIHDSSWRSSYGGGIFTWDGSHGCVNTPRSAVEKIYNNIESTYPVVVHY